MCGYEYIVRHDLAYKYVFKDLICNTTWLFMKLLIIEEHIFYNVLQSLCF